MKLKKLVSVALAGAMALSLTACGGGETAATTAAKEEAKATEAAKAETTGDLDKTIAHVVVLASQPSSLKTFIPASAESEKDLSPS